MSARYIIGITGGIGSGKSAVTEYLRSKGHTVICADEVSRQVVMPGQPGNDAIRQALGDDFFDDDGMLDRKKLGAYVFEDSQRVLQLNSLLHPIIVARIFETAQAQDGVVFIDAALLIQADMTPRVDRVWVVAADKDMRIRRVMARDKCTEQDVLRRMDNQMSDFDLIAYADDVIDNSGGLTELYAQIDRLLESFKDSGEKP